MDTARSAGFAVGATAVLLAGLAAGLPADTFYTGDPGVKLVAARNAIARPTSPLEIPLPSLGGERLPYLDPFFAIHNDHAHPITSELFPLASAPFIAAFGTRGAYLLPAAGFLLALAAGAWLGLLLDPRRDPALIVATAVLTTPLLFYGLEFWEHAPAVGLTALAAALFVASTQPRASHAWFPLAAGVLFGLAALMRPETIWFAGAVMAAATWLPEPPGARRTGLALAGLAAALAPLAVYALAHFGTLLTPHLAGNPALWAPGWLARRATLLRTWLVSIGPATAWITVPALAVALIPLPRGFDRGGRGFLAVTAALAAALIWLTAPNDGGAQWGPRYLLAVSVPLAILAADALQMLAHGRRTIGIAALMLVLVSGAAVQRLAYQRLRGTKQTYGQVLTLVEATSRAGGHVVTDLWWLDQVAAAAPERTFLYAADGAEGAAILQRLDRATAREVTVVRSREESPDPSSWTEGTCYGEAERREIPERMLVAIRLNRTC